ncbi:MAG: hypothetical protein ABIJ50_02650 [Pseudomonadota bacterium]
MQNKICILIFIIIIIGGCKVATLSKNKIFWDDILVDIELNKIELSKQDNNASSLVYGLLKIKGQNRRIKSVNLDCITLEINGLQSQKIYIDNVAYIFTSDYLAKNNQISVRVYWDFNHPIILNEVKSFDFSFNKPEFSKCIILE